MLRKALGIIFVAIGLGFIFYPDVLTKWQNHQTKTIIQQFENQKDAVPKSSDERYREAAAYNERISKTGQDDFRDAWICAQNPMQFQGFPNDCFGYIRIPAMKEKLPIYLGASEKNMSRGAAVLGGTSLPIGGPGTNSVIAAHRGYRGIPYFRNIELLKPGDRVYVRNPWEKLAYVVETIKIIDPYDTDAVKIQKGKDMVTLMTCHPYRSNGKKRYVVYCVRDTGQDRKVEDAVIAESSQKDIQRETSLRIISGGGLIIMSLFLLFRKRKK